MPGVLETQAPSIATLFLTLPAKVRIKSHWVTVDPKRNPRLVLVSRGQSVLTSRAWGQRKMGDRVGGYC